MEQAAKGPDGTARWIRVDENGCVVLSHGEHWAIANAVLLAVGDLEARQVARQLFDACVSEFETTRGLPDWLARLEAEHSWLKG